MINKTLLKIAFAVVISTSATQVTAANKHINALGGCQGFIDFIEKKLSPAPSKYPAADVKIVLKGLTLLDKHIQKTVIDPGFLEYAKGNQAEAKKLHKQLADYKKQVVYTYETRHPQHRLFLDFAISLNGCNTKAPVSAADEVILEKSLRMIITLSKLE